MTIQANEPTTGEIVRALRGGGIYGITTALELKVIDRLESQECEIEELKSEAIVNALENAERIANLTARAEQAEKERDEVEKSLARRIMQHLSDYEFDSTFVCEICEYNLTNSPKCLSCGSDHHHGKNFELKHILRGQPQDGDGK